MASRLFFGQTLECESRRLPVECQKQHRTCRDKTATVIEAFDPALVAESICQLHVNASETEWNRIATLYDRLLELTPTPVLALNRAVAHGMAYGPETGLALVDEIVVLDRYHLFHATRADMLRRLALYGEACAAYEAALAFVSNQSERDFLERRLAECRTA